MNLGYTPIRLQPEGRAEVVWTTRLDPARARIENVPYPSSGRRYGDVILHDGSPNGERLLGGQPVPVFDELGLLLSSPYSTFHARVSAALKDRMQDLTDVAAQSGVVAQNWTSGTRMLPRAESEGFPSAYQETALTGEAEIGIAARTEGEAWAFLQIWTQAQPLREVLEFHLGLAGSDAMA